MASASLLSAVYRVAALGCGLASVEAHPHILRRAPQADAGTRTPDPFITSSAIRPVLGFPEPRCTRLRCAQVPSESGSSGHGSGQGLIWPMTVVRPHPPHGLGCSLLARAKSIRDLRRPPHFSGASSSGSTLATAVGFRYPWCSPSGRQRVCWPTRPGRLLRRRAVRRAARRDPG